MGSYEWADGRVRQHCQSKIHDTAWLLHAGTPWVFKMLTELRKRFYTPKLAPKIQSFVNNCQMCIRTKPCQNSCIRPPLEWIYVPYDGPEDIMEIELLRKLLNSNGYSYVLMACDVLSRYLSAVPLRKPNTTSVVPALLQILTQHA